MLRQLRTRPFWAKPLSVKDPSLAYSSSIEDREIWLTFSVEVKRKSSSRRGYILLAIANLIQPFKAPYISRHAFKVLQSAHMHYRFLLLFVRQIERQ